MRETSHFAHLSKDRGDHGERSAPRNALTVVKAKPCPSCGVYGSLHLSSCGDCPFCRVPFVNAECPKCGDRNCSPLPQTPLCRCGHGKLRHVPGWNICCDCGCEGFMPPRAAALPSSPPAQDAHE